MLTPESKTWSGDPKAKATDAAGARAELADFLAAAGRPPGHTQQGCLADELPETCRAIQADEADGKGRMGARAG